MQKTANNTPRCCIFIPSWGNNRAISQYYYTKFLEKLTVFDDIYCLFYPNQRINHSIPQISTMAAQYIDAKGIPSQYSSITTIGYGLGGPISLDLLEWNPQISQNTHAAITISSPLYGYTRATNLFKLSSVISRATYDLMPNSYLLTNIHKDIHKIADIPKLSIVAGNDPIISSKNGLLENSDQTIVQKSFHINILQKPQTQIEINSWFTNKILNMNWLDKDIFPKIQFVDLSER